MNQAIFALLCDNKPLPLGTKIRTTVGGAYTGTMHELSTDVLASGNRVPNIFSDYVPFWILGWADLHDDLEAP